MVIVYIGTGYIQVLYFGIAPRTKETLPDFREKCRVTRHSRVFLELKGSQRTPGFWVVTYSPGNCCCRRIPLRESALPSYPYDSGRMLAACPLTPVWSSLTDYLSVGGRLYSWSVVCP